MGLPVKFQKATRKQAKASILIEGIQGQGKSGLALALAYYLGGENWDDVYAVDAENKSLCLFVGTPLHTGAQVGTFNVMELSNQTGYKPSIYAACRDLAVASKGKAIVNDSTTHMWQAKGGVLDMVTEASKTNKNKNAVWGEAEIMAEKQLIIDLMRSPDIHVINTVRMKEKVLYSTSETGQTLIEKAGEQPIMAPGIAFEPDLVLSMVKAGNSEGDAPIAKVDKSRYAIFKQYETYVFNENTIKQLREYLAEGADPAVIFEQQRQEYVEAVVALLDSNASLKQIWTALKDKQGCKGMKIDEIPLEKIKLLYSMLATD